MKPREVWVEMWEAPRAMPSAAAWMMRPRVVEKEFWFCGEVVWEGEVVERSERE